MAEKVVRLTFEGKAREYHPATGLEFIPGEAEYPKESEASLMATGRFKHALPPRKAAAADKEKE